MGAPPEVVSARCLHGVENPFVLDCSHHGLTRELPAADAGGEDHMAHSCERGNKRVPVGDVSANDLSVRAQPYTRLLRLPRQNPDASALTLKCVRGMQTGRPCAPDHQNDVVGHGP